MTRKYFELVDRKAEVGDRVIYFYEGRFDGSTTVVTEVSSDYVGTEPFYNNNGVEFIGLDQGAYLVIEPVEQEETSVTSPESLTDLIANLSAEVAKLNRKVDDLERKQSVQETILGEQVTANTENIRTISEGAMKTAYDVKDLGAKVDDHFEFVTADIVTLDERTQPEQLAETVAEQFAKQAIKTDKAEGLR